MITADQLLLLYVNKNADALTNSVPGKDLRVLQSLAKAVTHSTFITENQSRLLMSIFTDNKKALLNISDMLDTVLEVPTWSRQFRQPDTTKKMFITTVDDIPRITIEIAFSATLRKVMTTLIKTVSGLTQDKNGRFWYADLTEKNIILLSDELSKHGFEIHEKMVDFYNIIKSWDETEIRNQFELTNIVHDSFQKNITADLGINTAIDQNIISDRSVRYQYFSKKSEKLPENLTEIIATRSTPKIWVDRKTTKLDDVIQSLHQLKRFPVLVIFDAHNSKEITSEMRNFSEILENNGIYDNVGIYFRLDNNESGKEFNQFISDKSYNAKLDSDTKVVGIQSGKIPKFMLKTGWKPMSVIAIGNTLRHSKTAVYASCCDLIVTYTDKEPIVETRNLWE